MEKRGKLIAPETLQFERLLPGPIERVWEYLVDSKKRGQWLASGKTEEKVGGKMEFQFNHSRLSEEYDPIPEKYKEHAEGSAFTGEVLEIDKPQRIKFTWEGESVVTIELKQEKDKVLLTLTHEKLGNQKEAQIGTLAGWDTHLGILKLNLKGEKAPGFWKVHMPNEDFYRQQMEN